MKKLLFILPFVLFACKKNDPDPVSSPSEESAVNKLVQIEANGQYKHYYYNGEEKDGPIFNVHAGDSIRVYNDMTMAGTGGYKNIVKIYLDGNTVLDSEINNNNTKTFRYTVE